MNEGDPFRAASAARSEHRLKLTIAAALAALVSAVAVVMILSGAPNMALAGSGGTAADRGGGSGSKGGAKYTRLWKNVSRKNKRWARKTSRCESGGRARIHGGGGRYHGAFQFMKSTWRSSPKSPGGDPHRYNWRTQAVVAVKLKRRDGAGHWPNCG